MVRNIFLVLGLLYVTPNVFPRQYDQCGERSSRRSLLVGGKFSRRGDWPWQVAIYKQSALKWDFLCGGALVAPKWIITAAHCFFIERKSSHKTWFQKDIRPLAKFKIKAGDHELSSYESSEQEDTPQEIAIFPGYRHDPIFENDIALIKLTNEINLGPYVRTLCLPDTDVDLAKPGTRGTVAGWGMTGSGYGAPALKGSSFNIENDDTCDRAVSFYYNKTVAFCASDANGHSAPCHGDSGGSMVRQISVNGKYRWVAVGLVSWGGCALGNRFGYYTRLQLFIPWIFHKVNSTCMDLGHPRNGMRSPSKKIYQHSDIVTFSCKENFTMFGFAHLTCQRDGTWSAYKPLCLEVTCLNLGHPVNGKRIPLKDKYRPGQRVVFECNPNHTLSGKSSLVCGPNGKWSGILPHCFASCPPPSPPKNGSLFGLNFQHGQMVHFACKPNHKLVGSSFSTCVNGKWDNSVPQCAQPCTDPGIPHNGGRNGNKFKHGEQVVFFCDDNTKLVGTSQATCNHGKWSSSTPKCLAVCKDPGTVRGRKQSGTGFKYEFECDPGYKMKGPSAIRCKVNGVWDSNPPQCIRQSTLVTAV